ncbi:hypothetical protein [Pseudoduganella sp.]|uniref:hypothetical protein n=1 Tax=Pseudoduganella sp. TaxID=1880898 RepID=UPI0035B043DF
MSQSNPDNHFDNIDPTKLPSTVPMSRERIAYLDSILKKMRKVIENGEQLDETDSLFGKGEFFWPKDPQKPIRTSLSFEAGNFDFKSISLGFTRKSSGSPWVSAVLHVQPRNFPFGVFDMNLPQTFFSEFTLQRAYSQTREHESITTVNIFEFLSRQNGGKTVLVVEARPDVSSLSEGYPRSFHMLYITSNQ